MAEARPRLRLPNWLRPFVPFVVAVLAIELVARALFLFFVRTGTPPNCGVEPLTLARLIYAYSSGRYSSLPVLRRITLPDPNRGYRMAPQLTQVLGGIPLRSNSIGVRGRREFPVPKPPGTVRFVALGDSMTFGEGVGDESTWPAQLGARLNIEVVNLGERGYAHDQMYFALVDVGLRLQPDAVILGFFEGDLLRNDLSHYCYEKPRLVRGPSGWDFDNVPVATPEDLRARYVALPLLYATPKALVERYTMAPPTNARGEAQGKELLNRMRQRAEAAGARFVIVNIPEHVEAPPGPQSFFTRYCQETNAECVDPGPHFRRIGGTNDAQALRRQFLRPRDIHYNAAGYGVVAEALRLHFEARPL